MNNKQKYHLISIFLLFISAIHLFFYMQHGTLLCKGINSCWFVIQGGLSLVFAQKSKISIDKHIVCMVLGLFLGMCADVLLSIWFMAGLIVFAFGHVLYIIAFGSLEPFHKRDLWVALPVLCISEYLALISPFVQVNDLSMKIMVGGYAAIISLMVGKAISNFIVVRSLPRTLVLVGVIMFWFSDVVLVINMFGSDYLLPGWLCGVTYWPGQNILAYSLFHHVSTPIPSTVSRHISE